MHSNPRSAIYETGCKPYTSSSDKGSYGYLMVGPSHDFRPRIDHRKSDHNVYKQQQLILWLLFRKRLLTVVWLLVFGRFCHFNRLFRKGVWKEKKLEMAVWVNEVNRMNR